MKLMPENKGFLLLVLGLIGLLLVFQAVRSVSWQASVENKNADYEKMRSLTAREMGIRKRHTQLSKASAEWERRFVAGAVKEANLTLLGKTEEWAGLSGLSFDSVQMGADSSAAKDAAISIRGNSDFSRLQAFLHRIEAADFAVSVTAIRLKKESLSKEIRFELTLQAPLLRPGGERE